MSVADEIGEAGRDADDDRRAAAALRRALSARDAELADLRRKLDMVTSITEATIRAPKWLAPPRKAKRAQATASVMLTDTHFGEVVDQSEVEYLNAFDDAIAEARLRRFGEKAIRLTRDYIAGVELDGGVLFVGGDIFTGTIHDELLETNSETLYASVIHYIEPLLAVIRLLADEWGRLHVACTYGNHGRRTRKPRAKSRAQDNIEWLFYKVLERETRADRRITWSIPDSADTPVSVYATRYLLTHGDQFRGGSGIAGALSPLMLGQHRKTRRATAIGRPFDVLVIGHWHQYIHLPGLIVGGTLKGYDEYAYVSNFGYEPAQQAFWLTTPDHGVTITAPIHVEDRVAEGWGR